MPAWTWQIRGSSVAQQCGQPRPPPQQLWHSPRSGPPWTQPGLALLALPWYMGFQTDGYASPRSGPDSAGTSLATAPSFVIMALQIWRMAACPDLKRPPAVCCHDFMGFQNWRMAPCPGLKRLAALCTSWTQPGLALPLVLPWFYGIPKNSRIAPPRFGPPWTQPGLALLAWFYGVPNWRMAPCPGLKRLAALCTSWTQPGLALPLVLPWFYGIPKLTDRAPALWTALDSAGASFAGAAIVLWDSKLTDGTLSRSQTPPRALYVLDWPKTTPGTPPNKGVGVGGICYLHKPVFYN